jgi:hypothetical protein
MTAKKVLITGLTVALLTVPFFQHTGTALAKKQPDPSEKITESVKYKGQLSAKQVVDLAASFAKAASYVQAGGSYKQGEYKTFQYKGKTYRYLSSKIDTRKELTSYLQRTLTQQAAEVFIKEMHLISKHGRLAQLEADGGSLLRWDKAAVQYVKTDKKTKYYRLTVPVGDTGEKEVFIVEYQFVEKTGWRISTEPYFELDIPGNVNPAFLFFHHIMVNPDIAQSQFLHSSILSARDFRKGIKTLQYKDMKRVARNKTQVEYSVTFHVDLEADYKGPLNKGDNQMFFLIQQTGEMEFKIVSIGTGPHLIK